MSGWYKRSSAVEVTAEIELKLKVGLGLLCPHRGPVLHLSSSTSGRTQATDEKFWVTYVDLLSVSCSRDDLGPNQNEQTFDETQLARRV